jgi:hypothetical protein
VWVDVEGVALLHVVVDHRRQEVVGGGDGVHVAGEVQVQRLHGDDLAVAAAGGAALDPERRPHGRLADGDGRPPADVTEGLTEADRGGGLPLAQRCGRDRRDDDVPGGGDVGELFDRLELDLGDVVAVGLEEVLADAHLVGDVGQRLEPGLAGDVEVGREYHRHGSSSTVRPVTATPNSAPASRSASAR